MVPPLLLCIWFPRTLSVLTLILVKSHSGRRTTIATRTIKNRGGHFSRENPHLKPISHFSGPNSIFLSNMSCRKWEMGCKHSKSSFPTSDFPFLTSHISFPACCIPYSHSIIIILLVLYEHIISYELLMLDF